MRPFGLGLATVLIVAALASAPAAFAAPFAPPTTASAPSTTPEPAVKAVPIDREARAKGMKAAPDLVTAAKIPCTLTDARFITEGIGSDKIHAVYYEVACKEGLGFVLAVKDKAPAPTPYDCIAMSGKTPDGKPNNLACILPANLRVAPQLQAYMDKSGRDCTVNNVRYLGSNTEKSFYEASCAAGGGYTLEMNHDYSGKPVAVNCADYDVAAAVHCTLSARADQVATVDKVAAASGKPCTVKDRRFIGATDDGSEYREFACTDGSGFVTKSDPSGKFLEATDCIKAANIAGGCTLSDTRQAQTEQTNLYSHLAKKAGFDCAVSKYADFPTKDNSVEIVELACSNRPDGGVGFFPAADNAQGQVLNCLRSEVEGYHCSFTQTSALYDSITAELKAKGRTSCVVASARPFAEGVPDPTAKDKRLTDYVEVGCADGGPGYVLEYNPGVPLPVLHNCAEMANQSGGCQLPTNKKKA